MELNGRESSFRKNLFWPARGEWQALYYNNENANSSGASLWDEHLVREIKATDIVQYTTKTKTQN